MSQAQYRVILTGTLASGADPAQAEANLAQLFKLPPDRAEALVNEAPVVIKKGLDEATARQYQAALHKAGWLSELRLWEASEVSDSPAPAAPTPPEPSRAAAPKPLEASIAPPGALLAEPREVPPLQVDLSGITLAEPGAIIGDPREVPPLRVDLSELSLAEPGARLDEDPTGR